MPIQTFRDRHDAGKALAEKLDAYRNHADLVLALPRGGVPVGYEVALALNVPLDVFLVRKLGVPDNEELAMGAIATGGVRVLNDDVVEAFQIPSRLVDAISERERRELERSEKAYRDDRPPLDVHGHAVIVVDDGLATGATMWAAVRALREQGARPIVVGVPVASPDTCDELRREASDVVCARTPTPFYAVGFWYDNFDQTTDDEVRELLARSRARIRPAA